MSETAILAAVRAAVSAAMPTSKDWSDDPADPKVEKLDAFVVEVTRDNAVAAAMGSSLEEVQLTIQVEVFGKYSPGEDGRAIMKAKAETIRAAILGNVALGGLLDHIHCQALEVDLAKGEKRLSLAAVTFAAEATI